MTISKKRGIAMVAAAGALGTAVGTGAFALVANDEVPKISESKLLPASYPTNESGETYGEHVLGTVPPDLLEAGTDDGRPGYIRYSDLEGQTPSNPEEAARMSRERINEKGQIVVPVYEVDGTTQIGTFVAGTVTLTAESDQPKAE